MGGDQKPTSQDILPQAKNKTKREGSFLLSLVREKCGIWFIIQFDYPERPMITTRLRKDCSAKTLMVEFSTNSLPQALEQFHRSCKEEGVVVLRGDLNSNQLNFYSVLPSSSVEVRGVKLQGNPQSPRFILAIHYISSQWQEQAFQHTSTPTKRTLLLRQGLDTKFYHEYQFQNTQSQLESVVFLCQLSSTIINCQFDEGVNFYDQKAEEIKGVSNDNLREKLWRNVFYQIPGLGKEKCNAIANKYPTYQSLLEDYMTQRKLKNLLVSRGTKEVKLGQVLANRIYRCLFTEDGSLAVAEQ